MYLTDSRRLLFRGHLDLKNSNERGQTYLGIDIGEWRLNQSLVSSVLQVVQSVFRRDLTS